MTIVSQLSALTEGLLYYSESEYPFIIEQLDITQATELPDKLASLAQRSIDMQRTVTAEDFFSGMCRISDPNDALMKVNAEKAGALWQFLQQHLNTIKVTRVEGNTEVLIFITGFSPEGYCVMLRTTSIET